AFDKLYLLVNSDEIVEMLADWISIMDISAWFMLALPILPMMIPFGIVGVMP
ncbi:TPA: hypothetical protein TVN92_001868, partial [Streptococcus equi subsp. zooepidemicus]|nr:hypothetical protein [Streptococcus equi subsp. zooepidemicus]